MCQRVFARTRARSHTHPASQPAQQRVSRGWLSLKNKKIKEEEINNNNSEKECENRCCRDDRLGIASSAGDVSIYGFEEWPMRNILLEQTAAQSPKPLATVRRLDGTPKSAVRLIRGASTSTQEHFRNTVWRPSVIQCVRVCAHCAPSPADSRRSTVDGRAIVCELIDRP